MSLRALSLFTGIGLHDLGLQRAGITIAGQCEVDEFCVAVLEKNFPQVAHRWRDVRSLTTEDVRAACGRIDLLTGGFPCQDISVAGKAAGIGRGTRSGLWRELFRLVRGLRPDWLLLENVPALRSRGYDRIAAALEAIGYTCWPLVVGAEHSGAPHRRHRVWIVAHTIRHGEGWQRHDVDPQRRRQDQAEQVGLGRCSFPGRCWRCGNELANSDGPGRQELGGTIAVQSQQFAIERGGRGNRWPARPGKPQHEWEAPRLVESGVGGAVDGRARRLAGFARRSALKALGNANPPHVPEAIGRWMMQMQAQLSMEAAA